MLKSLLIRGPDAHLLYLQPLFLDLLSLETSSPWSGQRYSACPDSCDNNFTLFRDLLQATDFRGAGLDGRWPSLMLGQVGVRKEDTQDKYENDAKRLALMCLRRIQARTAIAIG